MAVGPRRAAPRGGRPLARRCAHRQSCPRDPARGLGRARDGCRAAPVRGIIVERDENLPPFGEILDEVERARAIGRQYGRWG